MTSAGGFTPPDPRGIFLDRKWGRKCQRLEDRALLAPWTTMLVTLASLIVLRLAATVICRENGVPGAAGGVGGKIRKS